MEKVEVVGEGLCEKDGDLVDDGVVVLVVVPGVVGAVAVGPVLVLLVAVGAVGRHHGLVHRAVHLLGGPHFHCVRFGSRKYDEILGA